MEQILRLDRSIAKKLLAHTTEKDLGKKIYNLLGEYIENEDPQLTTYLINSINRNKQALLHCLRVQDDAHQRVIDQEIAAEQVDLLFDDAMRDYEQSEKHNKIFGDFDILCKKIESTFPDHIELVDYTFVLGSKSFDLPAELDNLVSLTNQLIGGEEIGGVDSTDEDLLDYIEEMHQSFRDGYYHEALLELKVTRFDTLTLLLVGFPRKGDQIQSDIVGVWSRSMELEKLPIFMDAAGYQSVFAMWAAEREYAIDDEGDDSDSMNERDQEFLESMMFDYKRILDYYSLIQPKSIQNYAISLFSDTFSASQSDGLKRMISDSIGLSADDVERLYQFLDEGEMLDIDNIEFNVLGYNDGIFCMHLQGLSADGEVVYEEDAWPQNQALLLNIIEWTNAKDIYDLLGEDKQRIDDYLQDFG